MHSITFSPNFGNYRTIRKVLGDIKEKGRIFDAGYYNGEISKRFAREGYSVIGLDIQKDSLRWAARENAHPNVHYIQGNFDQTPLADNSMDAVICVGSAFNGSSNQQTAMNEFYRVLTPGGKIVISGSTEKRHNEQHQRHLEEIAKRAGFKDISQRVFGLVLKELHMSAVK